MQGQAKKRCIDVNDHVQGHDGDQKQQHVYGSAQRKLNLDEWYFDRNSDSVKDVGKIQDIKEML